MFNWRTRWLAMLGMALACPLSVHGQSRSDFRWINPQQDAALWRSVHGVFHSQLQPSLSDYGELYGYLKRVGVFGNSALVIVTYRTAKNPKGDQYSSAFNYNVATRSVSQITGLEYMWSWELIKLARFEASSAPDVVSTYYDCTGCEANEILTALRYDPAAHQWQVRRWTGPKDWTTDTGLIVESAPEPDDQIISSGDLYGLINLQRNGLDDVALRSRWVSETTSHHKHVDDWTLLYGAMNGIFVGRVVSDKREQMKVWSKLCVNSRNRLCKDVPTIK